MISMIESCFYLIFVLVVHTQSFCDLRTGADTGSCAIAGNIVIRKAMILYNALMLVLDRRTS